MPPSPATDLDNRPAPLVACLCAAWCGACRDYRPLFEALANEFATTRFVWIDIEDQAQLIDPLDVDDFPTLLVAVGGEPVFFGPITPQAGTLRRLVQTHLDCVAPTAWPDPNVVELVQRLLQK
jgi:thioredoxin 1